jgi:integrase
MKGRVYKVVDGFIVRFGRAISKRFRSLDEAERFLTGLRYENDKGTFDLRDYAKNKPLSFSNLADDYLRVKKKEVKRRSFNNLANYMARAKEGWGHRNVKMIGYAEIEDLLLAQDVSDKTKANMRSCLHDFWIWLRRRQVIKLAEVPEFPEVEFELGWRQIIDIKSQQEIIEKIYDISHSINPKIAIGIRWLSTYVSVRPGELLAIKEGHINRRDGFIIIPHPKEKKPKIVYLLEDDIELLRSIPEGLPDLNFFRHQSGISGCTAGEPFGPRYLWKWWKRGCEKLGITGVDLYGGTRHSTVTALGDELTPEQIKQGTLHSTNKAFERYFQGESRRARVAYMAARKVQQTYNLKRGAIPDKVLKIKE